MGIFDSIKKIVGGGGGNVIGLDIGPSSIKIVELTEKKGKPTLLKYGTLALGPFGKGVIGMPTKLATNKLVEAVNTAFKVVGVTTRKGALSIPLKLSLIVTIEIPQVEGGDMAKAISYEARKYIPVAPSEVNLSWSVLSHDNAGSMNEEKGKQMKKMKVLVAAIHNTTIQSYNELAHELQLNPLTLEIETFSAIRSVKEAAGDTFAMLDIGSEDSKVVINTKGSITTSHTISKGSHVLTETLRDALGISYEEAEKRKRKEGLLGKENEQSLKDILYDDLSYIFANTKRVIEEFEGKHSQKVETLVLIGGGAALKGIQQVAEQETGKKIIIGNAFSNVTLPLKELAPVLAESGMEYAVAMGLALRALKE